MSWRTHLRHDPVGPLLRAENLAVRGAERPVEHGRNRPEHPDSDVGRMLQRFLGREDAP